MEAGFEASLYPADTEYTEITATTIRQWFNFTLPAKGPNMVRSGGTGIGKRAKTVRANRSQSTAPEPMPPQGRWTGSKPPLVFRPFRYPNQGLMRPANVRVGPLIINPADADGAVPRGEQGWFNTQPQG